MNLSLTSIRRQQLSGSLPEQVDHPAPESSNPTPRKGIPCRHCGLPCPTGSDEQDAFCCHGCRFVHGLLHAEGLDKFYELQDRDGQPVASHVFHPRDFSWLDRLIEAEEAKSERPSLELDLQGISCLGCVWLLERLFRQQEGALQIEIQSTLGRLRIRWVKGGFCGAAWAGKVQKFGYLLAPANQRARAPGNAVVWRMGVAAALAMNCMLFSVPHYFGMEADFTYAPLFTGLAVLFATLSFLVGGTYFIKRAWQGLRMGSLHIDLPISVGVILAYTGSLYGWSQGYLSLLYFDFVAVFIFLMLLGRWTQELALERNRHYLLRQRNEHQQVRRMDSPHDAAETPGEPIASPDLQSGQSFLLQPGQYVPVRSDLARGKATFSLDWINGEPEARLYPAGREVPAGAVLAGSEPVVLIAREEWTDSHLQRLFALDTRDQSRHPLLESIIRWYMVVIFIVAGLGFAGWFFLAGDALRAFQVLISVLVVSCPCAIGVAWPLADETAAAALRRRGLFLKADNFWGRLGQIRHILLDKTGTLTKENLVLANPGILDTLDADQIANLQTMVGASTHPVCRCLREELWSRYHGPNQVGIRVREEAGQGLELPAPEGRYRLGRPAWVSADQPLTEKSSARMTVDFGGPTGLLARFHFQEALREGVAETIQQWQKDGFRLYLLSGDQPAKVTRLAAQLNLPADQAWGGLTADEKAAITRRLDHRDTLIIGDGANDSLAFNEAHLKGTPAIDRGLLPDKADFYFLGQNLHALRDLFAIGRQRRRVLRHVFTFTIGYNLMTITICLLGWMNPLLAAIVMPLSSLISITTVWSRRPR